MIVKVGEYYKDPNHEDIVQVTEIINDIVHFEITEDPKNCWARNGITNYTAASFRLMYVSLLGYNTPLYRAVNGN